MTNHSADISPRKAAKIAGVVYLICIVLGAFSNQFVRSVLIVPGDAITTVNNIMANELLFRIGFMADLIFLTVWLLLPLALYKVASPIPGTSSSQRSDSRYPRGSAPRGGGVPESDGPGY